MFRAFIIALLVIPASAQVFQITGGDSTMMGGAGGSITTYLPGQTISTGAGVANGHVAFGASDTFQFHDFNVTAGDSSFGYSVDNAGGLGITARGLAISRQSADQNIAVFAGAAGLGYNFPFFNAVGPLHAGGGIFYRRHIAHWNFQSLAGITGSQRTALQSASFQSGGIHFAAGGGLLGGQKTFTGSFDWRASKHLNLSASRNDLFWDGERAAVNSAAVMASFAGVNVHAMVLDSSSAGRTLTGQSFGGSYRIGWATVQSDFYRSAGQTILTQSVAETFRHWNFSESFSTTGNQHGFSFGGGYHSNHFSVALGHSVQFLPFANGFTQVTSISVSFHIPHTDSNVSLSTILLPTGPLYTANGGAFVQGPNKNLGTGPAHHSSRKNTGRFLITGRVVDKSGLPVEGAALMVGGAVVFTNSQGLFTFRERKAAMLTLRVLPEQFSAPGNWQAGSPAIAMPSPEKTSPTITIVVERKP